MGGGLYCPTKEQILTVQRYDNYTLNTALLDKYYDNQCVKEVDIKYEKLNIPIDISITHIPLPSCTSGDIQLSQLPIYIGAQITWSDNSVDIINFQSITCGSPEQTHRTRITKSAFNLNIASVKWAIGMFTFPTGGYDQNAFMVTKPINNNWNIILNNLTEVDPNPSSTFQAYISVPDTCTGVVNYEYFVDYSWNEVDGTMHDEERTYHSGNFIGSGGGTRYIMVGSGTFTPGENYWYSGAFTSNCENFNFSVHVDGTSSDGIYYS